MVYLQLFLAFCRVGFTSFGGLSMVPLINSEMMSHGWMTASEVSDIVAIAEMTPGPLGLNCATFAGTRVAGLLGAIVASLGVVSPTLLVASIVAMAFEKFKDSDVMQKCMFGIRPGCLGLILGVLVSLSLTNYLSATGSVSIAAIIIGIVAAAALYKFKLSIPLTILISAVLGLLLIR